MKNGFTMIELIFVIVILGILASVAIPKLASVHDEQNALPTEQEVLPTTPNSKYPTTIYSN